MKINTYLEYYKGKSGLLDKFAFICNSLILIIFLYDSIFSDIRMLFLFFPIVLIEIFIFIFCILPDYYYFLDDCFIIRHFCKKNVRIYYSNVFNIDADIKDNFININKSNEIKVYYLNKKQKKCVLCRTNDSIKFVSAIKKYCEVFKDTINSNTDISKLF